EAASTALQWGLGGRSSEGPGPQRTGSPGDLPRRGRCAHRRDRAAPPAAPPPVVAFGPEAFPRPGTLFAGRERLGSDMRGLLCTQFLDFAGVRFGPGAEEAGGDPCDRATCPGPQHVRTRAEGVAGHTGVPVHLLLELFGMALFDRLVRGYPSFFVGIESTLDLVA